MLRAAAVTGALVCVLLAGCTGTADGEDEELSLDPPEPGACRALEPEDVGASSDDSPTVPCTQAHTAETFLVAALEPPLADVGRDDPRLAQDAYRRCSRGFRKLTGADDSLALRTVLSWAWFRPSEEQWEAGARWYRCDVVGGTEESASLVGLPRTAEGVLLGIPADRWMACVDDEEVVGAVPVPCSEPHGWRAATTIVVGKEGDPYPGDRVVEVLSRDYCSDSVGAWLHYPLDYEYAYTWFGEAEWDAGNRRSVCWARTDQ
ncbi:septum formation family protein [Nocardioides caldifontis]|uniref:septum formation family protein n=1 Tax=Nocardioides caldifontis TaxID=2588938 RepID=UPI0011E023D6|nr:septum formation family protein [Nocardioides caldifontis]